MTGVLVDTDVFSFMFKRDSRAGAYHRVIGARTVGLSFMTVAELRAWAILRRWGSRRVRELEEAIRRCVTVLPDAPTVSAWATITAQRTRAGTPIGCADCWTAACAVRHGLPLVTHNSGDYEGIAGLALLRTDGGAT